jgi:LacI family transcriptional regulator
MKVRRPTVGDVARRAGVSLMTVSRVINAAPKVAASTRERVRAVIEELGFVPNRAARNLRNRRTHWIAVLGREVAAVPQAETFSYLADLQAGLISRCRQDGYHVAFDRLERTAAGPEAMARELSQRIAPDGVVLLPPLSDDAALLAALAGLALPVVRIAPSEPGEHDAPCVLMDDGAAAQQMTAYLVGLGHRRIGFILGHPEHVSSAQRHAGFLAAMRAHRMTVRKDDVVAGLYSADSGMRAARQLLGRGRDRCTAIFASNDDMAAGCLAVAHELGIRVPGELTVVGFDDSYVAGMLHPALTTVHQPIYDMGYQAANQLLQLLHTGEAARCVQLAHRIVERQSASPPSAVHYRGDTGSAALTALSPQR